MRPSRLSLAAIAFVLAVASAPAWAEEILHFSNGTTMPIRGHEIKGQMIHIDLGGDSSMAFPLSMVEKVEEAGKDVVLDPGSSANRRFGGTHQVTGTVPGRHSDSANRDAFKDEDVDPNVQTDKNGVAVYRPYAGSGAANKRELGAAGRQDVKNGRGAYRGTKALGSRSVIGVSPDAGKRMSAPVGFAQRDRAAPPPKPKSTPEGESDSSSSSGSESDE